MLTRLTMLLAILVAPAGAQEVRDPAALAALMPSWGLALSEAGGRGGQRLGILYDPASVELIGAPQEAFAQAAPAKARGGSSALGGLGGDSKEPIKIDADKLDVVDKENKAVFSGNVVAVQGETTVRCTVMTVLYEGRGGPGGTAGLADVLHALRHGKQVR